MTDLSIIIVSFNAKKLLAECLNSLPTKTEHANTEIIVVDNASTDGAPEMVEDKYPYIKLIRNSGNLGFAKANNIGMELSSGRYICLINSDAYALYDCLDKMCAYMDKNPKIGVLGPKLLNPDGTLQPNCREFPTLWNTICRAFALDRVFPNSKIFGGQLMSYFAHDRIREVDFLSGAFLMIRKAAIDQVGMFDENFFFYGEDKDWCKRFWKGGWKVFFYPAAKAVHYGGGSTQDSIAYYIKLTQANLQFYKKHYGIITRTCLTVIEFIHPLLRLLGASFMYILSPARRPTLKENINRNSQCIKWLMGHWNQYI